MITTRLKEWKSHPKYKYVYILTNKVTNKVNILYKDKRRRCITSKTYKDELEAVKVVNLYLEKM